jgi:hypothetical protein
MQYHNNRNTYSQNEPYEESLDRYFVASTTDQFEKQAINAPYDEDEEYISTKQDKRYCNGSISRRNLFIILICSLLGIFSFYLYFLYYLWRYIDYNDI